MLERGNHKSAREAENEESLLENYEAEVNNGWMFPVTVEYVKKLSGTSIILVGVAKQFTIDSKGARKIKRRTTHDASFLPPSDKSINSTLN